MGYREHAPPQALAPWLACVWEREAEAGAPVRVIPDGCIDIVWTEGAGTRVVGANSTVFEVSLAEGTHVIGVRMRPGAAPALLGVAGEAVVDARPELHEVWGDDGARLAEALERATAPRRVVVEELMRRPADAPDPLVGEAVARLRRGAAVADVARALFVSERQLRRRITSAVGYGPKRLARVLRLQRALEHARAGEELARVAFEAGYADQAHFTNDCVELAGAPPTSVFSKSA
ncbi:MAG TPA: DUF6597 domain-containing transcriptional factor [Solirubrobacteraceae bacterium]|jgi:AraC-like DNA-binding protein